ncbi:MAG: hypothetical protein JWP69_2350 [Flaviaesturariibacter sp.]|nr:hypothetical protein [Flaviaesturariibacter sp.]
MRTIVKLAIGVTIIALVRHFLKSVNDITETGMEEAVSEEGYETATDILYPNKKSFGENLHYGPVLPL